MITPITTKFINTIPLLNDACKVEKIKPIPYIQCNNVSPKINVLQQDVFEKQAITFGAKWPKPDLKQLWDKGRLPSVKFGFYGDVLTKENISREHLLPASKGGKKFITNIVLASKAKNNGRSNNDIRDYCNPDIAKEYLAQFRNIKIKGFSGDEYIRQIKITLKKLGIEL
jgi:hypothetical protein